MRKKFLSWALYDWANSSFSAIIQTFIFAAYFTQKIASNPVEGAAFWGWLNGGAALIIGISSPILGAIADHGGKKKYWLFFFTILAISATSLLWFAYPTPSKVTFALITSGTAIVAFEIAFIFYNAMLPDLAPPNAIGRWSGWGWGFGYAGGMASLIIALYTIILPNIDSPDSMAVRLTFLFCAIWYLVFSLPIFLLIPSVNGKGKPIPKAITDGLTELKTTFLEIKKYKNIVQFLIARLFFIDGLTTLFVFGGVFGAEVFSMTEAQIILFGILLHVSAGIGAVLFAWIDDLIGAKKVILFSLAGLFIPTLWLILSTSIHMFWILGFIIGIFVGPVQSASRSLMARLAPQHLRNEMFGFFALSGKGTTILGPVLTGWIIASTGSIRLGLGVICALFLIGGLVLLSVEEKRSSNTIQ